MKDTLLPDFCGTRSQQQVAQMLGWTQSAVSQALRSGREIHVVEHDSGAISAYEIRQIAGDPVRVEPVAIGVEPLGEVA